MMGRGQQKKMLLAVMAAGVAFVLLLSVPLEAAHVSGVTDVPVSRRAFFNINGDFAIIGNTMMTCSTSGINKESCPTAQASTASSSSAACSNTSPFGTCLNNNDFSMVQIDVNTTDSYPNSSRATLTMPAGSIPVFAALIWGADSASLTRDRVILDGPVGSGFANTTILDSDGVDLAIGGLDDRYSGFAVLDPTKITAGEYTVSNLQLDQDSNTTSNNLYGGWGLIVVYGNPALPLRNITVYSGFDCVSDGASPCATPTSITVNGFLTPLNGPVQTRLGALTQETDRRLFSSPDDSFELSRFPGGPFTQLSQGTIRAATNFFNSTISDEAGYFTAKNPNYNNNISYDIANLDISGTLLNGDTSATFQAVSGGDKYYISVLAFRTDLHVPIIAPNIRKTFFEVDSNGTPVPTPSTLLPGDRLRYQISFYNSGYDTATDVVLTDNIPANTTYVPGSLRVVQSSGGTAQTTPNPKTDTSGDDVAEYISTGTPRVVFRVGIGANSASGGQVPYTNTGTPTEVIEFDVTINSGIAPGAFLLNAASISFSGQTTALTFGAASSEARTDVMSPPVVTKSFSPNPIVPGDVSTLQIVVTNPGTNPSNPAMVVNGFTDTYPAGVVNANPPNPVITCTSGSSNLGTVTAVAGGGTVAVTGGTLQRNESCTIAVRVTAAVAGAYLNDIPVGAVTTTNAGSNTVAASATLGVGKPGITKAFGPVTVSPPPPPYNGNPILITEESKITFVITNVLAQTINGVTFTDTFPAGLVVATSPDVTYSAGCGGGVFTPAPASGQTSLTFSGGVIPPLGSCTITIDVKGNVAGSYDNTTSAVSSTETGPGAPSNTATLVVVAPPIITKSFSPPSVAQNAPSTLTIAVSNPNPGFTITGAAFTDTYPTTPSPGVVNATPPNGTLVCTSGSSGTGVNLTTGGAASVGMTNGTLLPGGSCTLTVQVISAVNPAPTPVAYLNNTGPVTTTNAGTGALASATLTITSLSPPTVTKAFAADVIIGGATTLTVTLTNPNTTAITGVAFTDNYPAGMVNAAVPAGATTCTPGTVTAVAGGGSLSLSGGTIPASGSCTVTVSVVGNFPGGLLNIIPVGGVTTTNAKSNTTLATATLDVIAPPVITKSFSPNPVAVAPTTSTLTIKVTNPPSNSALSPAVALTGVAFTDTYPPGLTDVNGGEVLTCTSGSSATIVSGTTGSVGISGGTLAPDGNCTLTEVVSAAAAGNYVNTITPPVTSTNGGNGDTATATLGVGQPGIGKTIVPSTIVSGTGSAVMTITLTNPTGSSMTAATFTDNFPVGMTLFNTTTTNSCLGSLTDNTGGTLNTGDSGIRLTGGTIPASGTCVITVNVTTNQSVINTIPVGGLTTSAGSNGSPATAALNVNQPPVVTKTFDKTSILECPPPCSAPTADQIATMLITITNPTAAAMTGVTFDDIFPDNPATVGADMFVVLSQRNTQTVCGGTFDRTGPSHVSYGISGPTGTIPANSSCTFTVDVYATSGAVTYLNSTGAVTSSAGNGVPATDTLTVMKPVVVEKIFSPNPVYAGQTSTLTLRLTNPNPLAVVGMTLTDTYPAGLDNALPSAVQTNCPGGVVTGVSGQDTVSLAAGTVEPFQFCEVTVSVVATATGSYPNTIPIGALTTTNAGPSPSALITTTLNVLLAPTATKAFSPNPLLPGGTPSTLTITLTNPNTTAITGVNFTDVYTDPDGSGVLTTLINDTASAATTCTPGTATAVNGPSSLSLLNGTIPASGSCTVTVNVTAPSIGSYFNSTGVITTQSPNGTISAATATLAVSASIYGNVYKDANHNASFESTETGTGLTLFAKLIRPVDPLNPQPAVVAVPVNTATGAYEFTGLNGALLVGSYTIVIDDNNSVADTTPVAQPIAPGWIATEEPTLTRVVTIPINEKASFFNDFGLFLGSKLTGRVFVDTGVGTGGIANDGLQNGTEIGLPGVTVKATHATLCPPTGVCDSTVTDGKGDYTLWIPSTAAGSLSVVETNLSAYLSTGGQVGNTGGTYTRATDTTTFTHGASTFYTGVNFADVPVNNFAPNDQGVGLPGSAIFYPHTFSAGTAGSVVFTSVNVPSPAISGWTHVIFRDDNCNATLDPAGLPPSPIPELPITGSIAVTAGQDVCIIVKEYLPAAAQDGEQDIITVTATFTYTGCASCPATVHTVTDTTLVGQTDLFLKKEICENPPTCTILVTKSTNQMPPGSEVVYRITYTNLGASPLNSVRINDMTPQYTTFVSAACGPLPAQITACDFTAPPPGTTPPLAGTGPVEWALTGALQPGAIGYVEYKVKID